MEANFSSTPCSVGIPAVVFNTAVFSNKSVAIPSAAEIAVWDDPASCILTVYLVD